MTRDALFSNLYIDGTLDLTENFGGKIILETAYPYDSVVNYKFAPEKETMYVPLAIRIPAWSENTKILLNGKPAEYEMKAGYAYISGEYGAEDIITVELDMEVKRVYTSTRVAANSGKAALQRGPLVYCAEGVDNDNDVLSLSLKKDGKITLGEYIPDKLCGIQELHAEGYREAVSDDLYSYDAPVTKECQITLVPYYSWANRGLNQMRVWIPIR